MSLNRKHELFTAKWQSGLVPGQLAAQACTVKVFTQTEVYANNTATVTEAQIFSGSARVQPVRIPRRNAETGDVAVDQTIRIQIPLGVYAVVPDKTRCRVLTAPLNADLVNKVFILTEVTDSGNPVERTFEGVLDTSG